MRFFTTLLLSGSLLTLAIAQTVANYSILPTVPMSMASSTQTVALLYQAKHAEHRGSGRRGLATYFNSQLG